MNICLIGDNITSLTLAKNLVNKNIKVVVYHNRKNNFQYQSRIIGISKNNLDFFNNNILKIKKNLIWKINGIDVFYNKIDNDKIGKNIFFIYDMYYFQYSTDKFTIFYLYFNI